jgi:hypothetical protein
MVSFKGEVGSRHFQRFVLLVVRASRGRSLSPLELLLYSVPDECCPVLAFGQGSVQTREGSLRESGEHILDEIFLARHPQTIPSRMGRVNSMKADIVLD